MWLSIGFTLCLFNGHWSDHSKKKCSFPFYLLRYIVREPLHEGVHSGYLLSLTGLVLPEKKYMKRNRKQVYNKTCPLRPCPTLPPPLP